MSDQTRFSDCARDEMRLELEGFGDLAELALNIRWSWNHSTDEIWQQIDPELWNITHNPWAVLQTASRDRIERVLADPVCRRNVDGLVRSERDVLKAGAWFQQSNLDAALGCVAYFSMEFMLSEALVLSNEV